MTMHLGHDSLADRVAASIRRHRAGDAQALDVLYGDVRPFLMHVALASGLTRHSAEDVVQNTMVSMLANLGRLRDPSAGLAWLSVIARREAIRVSREDRHADLVGDDGLDRYADGVNDPERIALARLARDVALRALAALPDRYRALLTMLFLRDISDYATIAVELDMPVGSIGPTRQRGLRKVRAALAADPEGDFVGAYTSRSTT
jgi:RNA polymerase sigma factor (sigma-70 family)